ncbi:hypothetical protein DSO57_1013978 [Entomophthora muscae]|uniref:Uncharacterized protein n=1 Tax=Entomophthora muscae TaxID=34485 RepID=A0ACC2RWW4_9FUNG|nr:hypothetical protein DSO57_1013978 [Entomophthora muscae]
MIWITLLAPCMATPYNISLHGINEVLGSHDMSKSMYPTNHAPEQDKEPLLSGVCFSPYEKKHCRDPKIIKHQIEMLSAITSRLRLYSIDCGQLELVLEAIDKKNLTLKVLAGLWTRNENEPIEKMVTDFNAILDKNPKYPSYIDGIVVGNEDIFSGKPEQQVIENINKVRSKLKGRSIPIGTAEIPTNWTPSLVKACDVIYANIYSFFDPKTIAKGMKKAARLVIERAEQIPSLGKKVVISETGWPSQGETASRDSYGAPTVDNQGRFLENFACRAAKKNMTYYIMEAFDGDWKEGPSVEKNFGLMTPEGQLKFTRFDHSIKC